MGGSDAEYGLFECAAGEGVSDCTVGGTVLGGRGLADRGGGGVSISAAGTRRLGVVLSGDKITVNVQDGGTQYSYAPGWTGWTAAWRQAGPRSGWRKIGP